MGAGLVAAATAASKAAGSIGLVSTGPMPAAWHCATASGETSAVRASMGTSAQGPPEARIAINIDNKITNTVTKEELTLHSDFIRLLTHRTRVIQVRRLSEKRLSRLEQFLMLFDQEHITNERYILDLEEVPEDFQDIANYLQEPLMDESFRKKLKAEQEIDDIFNLQEAELASKEEELKEARQMAEEAKQREEEERKNAQLAKQREELAKQREEEERQNAQLARQREEEARQREEEARVQQQKLQTQFAKHLLSTGVPIAQIVQMTGLSEDVIMNLSNL